MLFSHNGRNEHVLSFFQVSNLTKAICSSVKWKTEYNSKRLCHTIQSWLGEFMCLSWVHEWSQHPFLCGLWWVFVGLSVCHTVIFPYYCTYEFITEVWASSLKKKKIQKTWSVLPALLSLSLLYYINSSWCMVKVDHQGSSISIKYTMFNCPWMAN